MTILETRCQTKNDSPAANSSPTPANSASAPCSPGIPDDRPAPRARRNGLSRAERAAERRRSSGVGGQGSGNARSVASENLVAFCDVDPAFMERNVMGGDRAGPAAESRRRVAFRDKFQKATKYVDFREMLAKQRDLDAVIIATPDHMHATVAAAAMRAGKHVYCQKPLTYSVYESRLLKRIAKETKSSRRWATRATRATERGASSSGSAPA